MAFTPKEQEIIKHGVMSGKSSDEIKMAVMRSRLNTPFPKVEQPEEGYGDRLANAFGSGVDKIKQGVQQTFSDPGMNPLNATQGIIKAGAGAVEAVTSPITAAVEPVVKPVVNAVVDKVSDTAAMQRIAGAVHEGGVLESMMGTQADMGTVAGVPLAVRGAAMAGQMAGKAKTGLSNYFQASKTVEDLVTQAESVGKIFNKTSAADDIVTPASAALKEAEAAAPTLTPKELFAGVRPDIKGRIQGKVEKLKEYFEVAQTRNLTDQAPNPFEYGASKVGEAQASMESLLNDTGSKIGSFRQKISTYKALPDDAATVEQAFAEQLDKLNLSVARGQVVKKSGKIAQTISDAEVNALQSLYDDMRTYLQSPTVENGIAFRNKLRNKINFGKSSQEVSGTVDPLSRAVQGRVKEVLAKQVGKSEAGNLDEYSKLMEALDEIKSYTDRRAGSEFLIKQVLSERGGDARAVINTIKEYTGIDLMDDAVMARLATDIVGNDAQKGMFRQEITRAGLDAKALLTGDAKGLVSAIYQRGMDYIIDPKQVYLDAAMSNPKGLVNKAAGVKPKKEPKK